MPAHRLTCAVGVCNNYYYRTREMLYGGYPITYHYFPRQSEMRKRWIEACNRTDDFKPEISFICSIHFRPEDFIFRKQENTSEHSKRKLKCNVIPTRNLTLVEVRSNALSKTWRQSDGFLEHTNTVEVVLDSESDISDEEPSVENLNDRLNTSSEEEYDSLQKKYNQLLKDYEDLKVTSNMEIERLKQLIQEKDEQFTEKLRKIVSNYLKDTEIDLVLFLRKQKRENALS